MSTWTVLRSWRVLVLVLVWSLGGAAAMGAAPTPQPQRVRLVVGAESGVDVPRMLAALRLYLGADALRVVRVVGQPSEAATGSQATSAPAGGQPTFVAWWHVDGQTITVELAYRRGAATELLSFTVPLPSRPTPNFYRSVALKLKTLLRVATASTEDAANAATPASRPAVPPSVTPERQPPAVTPTWRFGLEATGGLVFTTDAGGPLFVLGGRLCLRRDWLELAVHGERSLGDERRNQEGHGEVVLSQLAATVGYRHTWLLTSSLRWTMRGGLGGGVGWLEASGMLGNGQERRSTTEVLALLRLFVSTGLELWNRLELSAGPAADFVLNPTQILLQKQELGYFGPLLPRLDVAVRFTF